MNKTKTLIGASIVALGSTFASSAFADQNQHACSDITTTTDVTQCIEEAISTPNLMKYLETIDSNPEMKDVYQKIDADNEACAYLSQNAAQMRHIYDQSYYYQNMELYADAAVSIQGVIKDYFEKAAICYGDSIEAYEAAGIDAHQDSLPIIRDAAQAAADAITFD